MATELTRFHAAQDDPVSGIDTALVELREGRKRRHWIWYVFPQLAGLGSSPMAVRFGLRDLEEARAYLNDAVLASRLAAAAEAVADQLGRPAPPRLEDLMGSTIDAQKLVSSMTLFRAVAGHVQSATPAETAARIAAAATVILRTADDQGLPPCAFTLRAIRTEGLAAPPGLSS